ncbi:MAG: hypothetical protein FGM32_05140 [Candidatus Kapabacteria bacterium]|nr:hypothetical protein [Candidatus Kapabacteria bacterium]
MKTIAISIVVVAVMAATVPAPAQTTTDRITLQGGPTADDMLKPAMKVGQIKTAVALLPTVEIRMTELDSYLDLRNVLTSSLDKATSAKKSDDDALTVEMRGSQLFALSVLLTRMDNKSADSTTIKDLGKSLNEAVTGWKPSKK